MGYSRLIVEKKEDHVATVTLNRPDKMNAFDSPLAEELLAAFMELDGCSVTRVILVKGAGRNFCAGIDVSEITGKNALEYQQWVNKMGSPLFFISRMKKPVIAQVHGVAAANGLGLAASADLAIAAEDARMGLTAINLGLNCVGPVLPVARCVGRKRAMELLLSGTLVKAPEALEMGLVNKVVPADELEKEARAWAAAFAAKSPLALQLAKSAFYTAEDMEYEKQFAYMNEVFARLCTTEDAQEGVKAFFEKREPLWQGR